MPHNPHPDGPDGGFNFLTNFSAKITTNKKDIASSDLKIYNDISDVEDIELLL